MVHPLVTTADPLHSLPRLRGHRFTADVAMMQEFAVLLELTQSLAQCLVDLAEALAYLELVQAFSLQDSQFLFLCRDLRIALEHLEASVDKVDAIKNGSELGRLVHHE